MNFLRNFHYLNIDSMNCLTKRLGHWTCYMTTAGTAETPYWHQRCTSTILYPQTLQEKKNANLETNRGTPLLREVVFFSSTYMASVICTFWSSKLCFLTGKHVYTAESCPLMCMKGLFGFSSVQICALPTALDGIYKITECSMKDNRILCLAQIPLKT